LDSKLIRNAIDLLREVRNCFSIYSLVNANAAPCAAERKLADDPDGLPMDIDIGSDVNLAAIRLHLLTPMAKMTGQLNLSSNAITSRFMKQFVRSVISPGISAARPNQGLMASQLFTDYSTNAITSKVRELGDEEEDMVL
jgi:hypothetical protein